MGWLKRGTGRTYDSKAGVDMIIGNSTEKICAYSVRNKEFRKCQFYSNKGLNPSVRKRDYRKCQFDSNKGLASSVRNKDYRKCQFYSNKGLTPSVRYKDYRKCQFDSNKGLIILLFCHKNWEGSSKAMEPDVGGELVKTIEAQGAGAWTYLKLMMMLQPWHESEKT